MINAQTSVRHYMTPLPHTVRQNASLDEAQRLMLKNKCRHLPVQIGGRLQGVVTSRDLDFASSLKGKIDWVVEEVMTPDPYTVTPDARLVDVVRVMSDEKFGCAIVIEGDDNVVGIFTTIDAMKAFVEVIEP